MDYILDAGNQHPRLHLKVVGDLLIISAADTGYEILRVPRGLAMGMADLLYQFAEHGRFPESK